MLASKAEKNTQPPILIQRTRGSQPCEIDTIGMSIMHQRTASFCSVNNWRCFLLQHMQQTVPQEQKKARAERRHLQKGLPALLLPNFDSTVTHIFIAAGGALRHEPRLQHVKWRCQDACHCSCQSTYDSGRELLMHASELHRSGCVFTRFACAS